MEEGGPTSLGVSQARYPAQLGRPLRSHYIGVVSLHK